MTKAEKALALQQAQDMVTWTGKKWATFNRNFAADLTVVARLEINKMAYKAYMEAQSLAITKLCGGHYAQLTEKAGASYVDYAELFAELRTMGIDTDALTAKHTKRRAPTLAFIFK